MILVLGSAQAFSMGKPTNLFAARKQLNSKITSAPATQSSSSSSSWRLAREARCQITALGKVVKTLDNFRR